MKTVFTNQFDGGQTNDGRDPTENVCRVIKHFDNYTNTYKLTPYRDTVLDAVVESTLDTYRITKFVIANGALYGVGIVGNGDNHTQVYKKFTGTDPTAIWSTASGGTSSSSVESGIQPLLYHNYLYGVNTAGVWKYGDITGSASFTYNEYTSHIPTAPGIVHSKDDIMYWPSGNLILANNGGSWSVGLTLPANCVINCICEDGNYVDIACDMPNGTSIVYQWDRDTSLTTLSEKIDWGVGSLKLIEVIGGVLSGISTTSANLTQLNPRVMFKYYTGSRLITFQEFVCSFVTIGTDKQQFNNLFYFLADMTIDGTVYKGLWKIFKNPAGNMAISFDRLPRNDTALSAAALHGFIRWGDYVFIAYQNPADSKYTIWRTDDQAFYTATSIYETTINPKMPEIDRPQKKKLISVGALYEALPSGAQALVQYRVDGGQWLTVFVESADGQVRTEPVTRAQASQFTDGTEYEFHVESTGGAEITALLYKYEIIPTNS